MNLDDLKKLNKQKKLVKKLMKQYDAFLASDSVIKQIPRVLGSLPNKMGKFPSPITQQDNLLEKVEELKAMIKVQIKKALCLGMAVGTVEMTEDQLLANIMMSANFIASQLKKNWQNIKSINIKTTMGKPKRLF